VEFFVGEIFHRRNFPGETFLGGIFLGGIYRSRWYHSGYQYLVRFGYDMKKRVEAMLLGPLHLWLNTIYAKITKISVTNKPKNNFINK